MIERVELLQAPAEWRALTPADVVDTTCVVLDVLRATSTMLTALAHGAARVVPVSEIADALAWKAREPGVLLAGERDGVRILGTGANGVNFDFGNSPRELDAERVHGRTIVITTTNGTRALRACNGAQRVLLGAFVNLGAVAARLRALAPPRLLIVAAGTNDEAAFEDSLAAGALCERLQPALENAYVGDAARMARELYRAHAADLTAALGLAVNGMRLLARPELAADVAWCARVDLLDVVAELTPDGSAKIS
jgi:2-phosphosulfolactate phosphatase